MPDELAVLLPAGAGPSSMVEDCIAHPGDATTAVLGLFLASPLLNVDIEARRLARAGVRWIANLPSVCQQDAEFCRQLVDVGLDIRREFDNLARFRENGFSVAAVVNDAEQARAATRLDPGALIVMPRVADFAAGFPSLRQRASAVQSVYDGIRDSGFDGMILSLGETREAASEGLWPPRADGLLCRPVRLT